MPQLINMDYVQITDKEALKKLNQAMSDVKEALSQSDQDSIKDGKAFMLRPIKYDDGRLVIKVSVLDGAARVVEIPHGSWNALQYVETTGTVQ